MIQFNPNIIGNRIAISCDTFEKFKALAEWANSKCRYVYDPNNRKFQTYKEATCISVESTDSGWAYCKVDWYTTYNYQILTFEQALLKFAKSKQIEEQ